MNSQLHGRALIRRVMGEHRRLVTWLGVVFLGNLFLYALAVYPLAQRVANIEERDRAAEEALAAARAEYDAARGTLTGKERAAAELGTFYKSVLPPDLAGARRLTHLRLPQLARESDLRFERSSSDPVRDRESSLTRLKIEVVLRGTYDAMRTFIYQLEAAPEFVVIDDITLAEGSDERGPLMLTLQLSTYFHSEP